MGNIRLYGATSGYTELTGPDIGSNTIITLPGEGDIPSVVISAIEPINKTEGDIWLDITQAGSPTLKIWDGSVWIAASSAGDNDQIILATRMFS